ncbi:MAG: long-chain fatty acid--CoA ligase [Planctomycetota bacterium]|nr:MAG: long-chain fatty acid--CoA ligase [Planctomycetota bacterium]
MMTMRERAWHAGYDEGVAPSIDYEKVTIPEFFRRTAAAQPDSIALYFLNASLTYGELEHEVDGLAAGMAKLGVEPGKRVAIHLPNMPQAVIAYYAALTLGAEVVLTNPMYTGREIEHQWNDAQCCLAVTTDYLYDQRIRDRRADLAPETYILARVPEYLRFPLKWLAPFKLMRQEPPAYAGIEKESGVHVFRDLIDDSDRKPPRPHIAWDSVAVLQYTGGTTGVSKGAMLTHKNLAVNVQQMDAWFGAAGSDDEVMLVALPLFHVFGMTVGMNWSVSRGWAMVLLPDPRDTRRLVQCIEKRRVTILPAVPAIFNALNNYPGIEDIDVSSLKSCISGSAPITQEVLERFEELTGARILEGFGMSETSPVTHVNPHQGERRIGKVGLPIPDTDAKIVDLDTGLELPPGKEGELVVRGPQVMLGYWNQPEETARALQDGWLHTGDLAVMDDAGYFQIVGRKKDMINCRGFKVFPDEVDRVLMGHPAILEAATIGVPDPVRGETVKSFVVLHPGMEATAEEIQAYARERLAAYKLPRQIEFIPELPKSTVLKVLRRELRDRELKKRA